MWDGKTFFGGFRTLFLVENKTMFKPPSPPYAVLRKNQATTISLIDQLERTDVF